MATEAETPAHISAEKTEAREIICRQLNIASHEKFSEELQKVEERHNLPPETFEYTTKDTDSVIAQEFKNVTVNPANQGESCISGGDNCLESPSVVMATSEETFKSSKDIAEEVKLVLTNTEALENDSQKKKDQAKELLEATDDISENNSACGQKISTEPSLENVTAQKTGLARSSGLSTAENEVGHYMGEKPSPLPIIFASASLGLQEGRLVSRDGEFLEIKKQKEELLDATQDPVGINDQQLPDSSVAVSDKKPLTETCESQNIEEKAGTSLQKDEMVGNNSCEGPGIEFGEDTLQDTKAILGEDKEDASPTPDLINENLQTDPSIRGQTQNMEEDIYKTVEEEAYNKQEGINNNFNIPSVPIKYEEELSSSQEEELKEIEKSSSNITGPVVCPETVGQKQETEHEKNESATDSLPISMAMTRPEIHNNKTLEIDENTTHEFVTTSPTMVIDERSSLKPEAQVSGPPASASGLSLEERNQETTESSKTMGDDNSVEGEIQVKSSVIITERAEIMDEEADEYRSQKEKSEVEELIRPIEDVNEVLEAIASAQFEETGGETYRRNKNPAAEDSGEKIETELVIEEEKNVARKELESEIVGKENFVEASESKNTEATVSEQSEKFRELDSEDKLKSVSLKESRNEYTTEEERTDSCLHEGADRIRPADGGEDVNKQTDDYVKYQESVNTFGENENDKSNIQEETTEVRYENQAERAQDPDEKTSGISSEKINEKRKIVDKGESTQKHLIEEDRTVNVLMTISTVKAEEGETKKTKEEVYKELQTKTADMYNDNQNIGEGGAIEVNYTTPTEDENEAQMPKSEVHENLMESVQDEASQKQIKEDVSDTVYSAKAIGEKPVEMISEEYENSKGIETYVADKETAGPVVELASTVSVAEETTISNSQENENPTMKQNAELGFETPNSTQEKGANLKDEEIYVAPQTVDSKETTDEETFPKESSDELSDTSSLEPNVCNPGIEERILEHEESATDEFKTTDKTKITDNTNSDETELKCDNLILVPEGLEVSASSTNVDSTVEKEHALTSILSERSKEDKDDSEIKVGEDGIQSEEILASTGLAFMEQNVKPVDSSDETGNTQVLGQIKHVDDISTVHPLSEETVQEVGHESDKSEGKLPEQIRAPPQEQEHILESFEVNKSTDIAMSEQEKDLIDSTISESIQTNETEPMKVEKAGESDCKEELENIEGNNNIDDATSNNEENSPKITCRDIEGSNTGEDGPIEGPDIGFLSHESVGLRYHEHEQTEKIGQWAPDMKGEDQIIDAGNGTTSRIYNEDVKVHDGLKTGDVGENKVNKKEVCALHDLPTVSIRENKNEAINEGEEKEAKKPDEEVDDRLEATGIDDQIEKEVVHEVGDVTEHLSMPAGEETITRGESVEDRVEGDRKEVYGKLETTGTDDHIEKQIKHEDGAVTEHFIVSPEDKRIQENSPKDEKVAQNHEEEVRDGLETRDVGEDKVNKTEVCAHDDLPTVSIREDKNEGMPEGEEKEAKKPDEEVEDRLEATGIDDQIEKEVVHEDGDVTENLSMPAGEETITRGETVEDIIEGDRKEVYEELETTGTDDHIEKQIIHEDGAVTEHVAVSPGEEPIEENSLKDEQVTQNHEEKVHDGLETGDVDEDKVNKKEVCALVDLPTVSIREDKNEVIPDGEKKEAKKLDEEVDNRLEASSSDNQIEKEAVHEDGDVTEHLSMPAGEETITRGETAEDKIEGDEKELYQQPNTICAREDAGDTIMKDRAGEDAYVVSVGEYQEDEKNRMTQEEAKESDSGSPDYGTDSTKETDLVTLEDEKDTTMSLNAFSPTEGPAEKITPKENIDNLYHASPVSKELEEQMKEIPENFDNEGHKHDEISSAETESEEGKLVDASNLASSQMIPAATEAIMINSRALDVEDVKLNGVSDLDENESKEIILKENSGETDAKQEKYQNPESASVIVLQSVGPDIESTTIEEVIARKSFSDEKSEDNSQHSLLESNKYEFESVKENEKIEDEIPVKTEPRQENLKTPLVTEEMHMQRENLRKFEEDSEIETRDIEKQSSMPELELDNHSLVTKGDTLEREESTEVTKFDEKDKPETSEPGLEENQSEVNDQFDLLLNKMQKEDSVTEEDKSPDRSRNELIIVEEKLDEIKAKNDSHENRSSNTINTENLPETLEAIDLGEKPRHDGSPEALPKTDETGMDKETENIKDQDTVCVENKKDSQCSQEEEEEGNNLEAEYKLDPENKKDSTTDVSDVGEDIETKNEESDAKEITLVSIGEKAIKDNSVDEKQESNPYEEVFRGLETTCTNEHTEEESIHEHGDVTEHFTVNVGEETTGANSQKGEIQDHEEEVSEDLDMNKDGQNNIIEENNLLVESTICAKQEVQEDDEGVKKPQKELYKVYTELETANKSEDIEKEKVEEDNVVEVHNTVFTAQERVEEDDAVEVHNTVSTAQERVEKDDAIEVHNTVSTAQERVEEDSAVEVHNTMSTAQEILRDSSQEDEEVAKTIGEVSGGIDHVSASKDIGKHIVEGVIQLGPSETSVQKMVKEISKEEEVYERLDSMNDGAVVEKQITPDVTATEMYTVCVREEIKESSQENVVKESHIRSTEGATYNEMDLVILKNEEDKSKSSNDFRPTEASTEEIAFTESTEKISSGSPTTGVSEEQIQDIPQKEDEVKATNSHDNTSIPMLTEEMSVHETESEGGKVVDTSYFASEQIIPAPSNPSLSSSQSLDSDFLKVDSFEEIITKEIFLTEKLGENQGNKQVDEIPKETSVAVPQSIDQDTRPTTISEITVDTPSLDNKSNEKSQEPFLLASDNPYFKSMKENEKIENETLVTDESGDENLESSLVIETEEEMNMQIEEPRKVEEQSQMGSPDTREESQIHELDLENLSFESKDPIMETVEVTEFSENCKSVTLEQGLDKNKSDCKDQFDTFSKDLEAVGSRKESVILEDMLVSSEFVDVSSPNEAKVDSYETSNQNLPEVIQSDSSSRQNNEAEYSEENAETVNWSYFERLIKKANSYPATEALGEEILDNADSKKLKDVSSAAFEITEEIITEDISRGIENIGDTGKDDLEKDGPLKNSEIISTQDQENAGAVNLEIETAKLDYPEKPIDEVQKFTITPSLDRETIVGEFGGDCEVASDFEGGKLERASESMSEARVYETPILAEKSEHYKVGSIAESHDTLSVGGENNGKGYEKEKKEEEFLTEAESNLEATEIRENQTENQEVLVPGQNGSATENIQISRDEEANEESYLLVSTATTIQETHGENEQEGDKIEEESTSPEPGKQTHEIETDEAQRVNTYYENKALHDQVSNKEVPEEFNNIDASNSNPKEITREEELIEDADFSGKKRVQERHQGDEVEINIQPSKLEVGMPCQESKSESRETNEYMEEENVREEVSKSHENVTASQNIEEQVKEEKESLQGMYLKPMSEETIEPVHQEYKMDGEIDKDEAPKVGIGYQDPGLSYTCHTIENEEASVEEKVDSALKKLNECSIQEGISPTEEETQTMKKDTPQDTEMLTETLDLTTEKHTHGEVGLTEDRNLEISVKSTDIPSTPVGSVENTKAEISVRSTDIPSMPVSVIEKSLQISEVDDQKHGGESLLIESELKEVDSGRDKSMPGLDEETIAKLKSETVNVSSSHLLQESTEDTMRMVGHSVDKGSPSDNKEKGSKEVPTTQNEEEEDGEKEKYQEGEEQDENKMVDSGSDAPVMVEASRDIDVKPAHKKSHNILSGVGSKVKQSISKVKKAITGKSSHHKQLSPK